MKALYQRYTFISVLILLMFASGYSRQLAIGQVKASGWSVGPQTEPDIYRGRNSLDNTEAMYQAGNQAAAKTGRPKGTIIAPDTGNNALLFGDCDTGTIQQLSGGQLSAFLSDQAH